MEALVAKIISLIIFMTITLGLGSLPFFLVSLEKVKATKLTTKSALISYLNCFAGGVFFGTGLLILMTFGQSQFEEFKGLIGFDNDFPFFETGIGVGLFLIALLDRVAHALVARDLHRVSAHEQSLPGKLPDTRQDIQASTHASLESVSVVNEIISGSVNHAANSQGHLTYYYVPKSPSKDLSGASLEAMAYLKNKRDDDTNSIKAFQDPHLPISKAFEDQPSQCYNASKSKSTNDKAFEDHPSPISKAFEDQPSPCYNTSKSESTNDKGRRDIIEIENGIVERDLEETLRLKEEKELRTFSKTSGFRAVLLLVAMSFHTIFDGLAVGLQESATDVWSITLGVSIHKVIVAFCLGLKLALAMPDKKCKSFVCMFFFSLMTPIGIAIGIGVTSGGVEDVTQLITASVLQALATGMFFYVTFFEVLGQEMSTQSHGDREGGEFKIFLATFGFLTIACVKVLDKD